MSGPWAEQPIVVFTQTPAGDITAAYAPDVDEEEQEQPEQEADLDSDG